MSGPGQVKLPVADAAAVRRAAWRLIRQDDRAMIVVVVLNSLAAAAGLAGPWLLGTMVNEFQTGGDTSAIDLLALAIVCSVVVHLLLTRFARYAGQRVGERALSRLREQFVERVMALPTSVVEKAGTGDLMTRSTGDVAVIGSSLRDAVPQVFIAVMQGVFIFAAIFLLHPLLGLCSVLGLPALWLITRWYLRRARDAYLAEGQAGSEVSESLAATLEGARTVEAFRLSQRRIDVADRTVEHAYDARVRTLFLRSVLFPVVDISHALPVTLMLLAGGAFYTNGAVSLGAVITASLYAWQLVDPVDRILMWIEQLQRSGASFARIEGVGEIPGETPPTTRIPVDDHISVTGARFAYTDDHDVLDGIDLDVRPGERLAVVGLSGAGKTTLGRLLAGVDAPRAGSVTVGQVPVAELPPRERHRRVILVTQEHHVFLGTVRDNLAIASPEAGGDMYAALAAVGADWVHTLPDGLDTPLGPGGTRLDAGQAQQLALARVVMSDPHTVILDEATALLDPVTARHVERSMAAVLEGRTVIAIAHRLHSARDADRVAVVEHGRIAEIGSHDDLVAANGSYAALWHSWHGVKPSST
jgi:ATP-binding cassette subfamily C protein